MIRTITERMRCMLVHFDLPEAMWGEAAVTFAYCVTIVPNSVRGMEVPYSVWHRQTPAYAKLRTFDCAVLSYVDKVERQKMEIKAREAIFVGYARDKRGCRLLDIKPHKAFYSHTVVFYSNKAGRFLTEPSSAASAVSTKGYFCVDSTKGDDIESILDEMHEGEVGGANNRTGSRTGGAEDSMHDDQPGGPVVRSARSREARASQ